MNEKHRKNLLLFGGVFAAVTTCFFIAKNTIFSPDVVAEGNNEVKMVSNMPQSQMQKTAPKEYNGEIRKVVYLTFDDGPSKYTDKILDVLKKEDIKATFYMIGKNMNEKQYHDAMKRLVKEGHYPGLHSMTHQYDKLYKQGHFVDEMTEAQGLVKKITGVTPHMVRPPYGSSPGLNEALRTKTAEKGFKVWDWTVDSQDWNLPNNPNGVVEQIKKQVGRNTEVILMHEKSQTLQALPQIIKNLKEKGYDFEVYNESQHEPHNFWEDERL